MGAADRLLATTATQLMAPRSKPAELEQPAPGSSLRCFGAETLPTDTRSEINVKLRVWCGARWLQPWGKKGEVRHSRPLDWCALPQSEPSC